MKQNIGMMTYLVNDYDEAIKYFTEKLKFDLVEDTNRGKGKRWVRVTPKGSDGFCLLLAKATTEEQIKAIGNQTGGRVAFFIHTDDFWRDYNEMKAKGIGFTEEPRNEEFGTVVVFKDLYGNKWDFIEEKLFNF